MRGAPYLPFHLRCRLLLIFIHGGGRKCVTELMRGGGGAAALMGGRGRGRGPEARAGNTTTHKRSSVPVLN
jgi:hypothetical protein